MKVKKTIELEITKKGKYIICRDLATMTLICGSKSVGGNLKMYGVLKQGNQFFISITELKNRIKTLEYRKKTIQDSLDIMRQLI